MAALWYAPAFMLGCIKDLHPSRESQIILQFVLRNLARYHNSGYGVRFFLIARGCGLESI